MSLNKIDLPPRLVAQLYSRTLSLEHNTEKAAPAASLPETPAPDVVAGFSPANAASVADPVQTEWKSLGNNQQHIMIVVEYTSDLHLPETAFTFLSQMLNACKLGPHDVSIINRMNYADTAHQELLDHFSSKVVLLFGVTAAGFGFPFEIPPYQVQQFAGYTVMYAPALDVLKDDKPAKTQLWNSFKKIFNL
ncbi:MAG TPA: hypothetical protein VF421_06735 [Niabella sp.]